MTVLRHEGTRIYVSHCDGDDVTLGIISNTALVCVPVLPIQIDNSQRVVTSELGKLVTPSFTEIEHIIFGIQSARRGGHFRINTKSLSDHYVSASQNSDHPLSGVFVIDRIMSSLDNEEERYAEPFWSHYWIDVSIGYSLMALCVFLSSPLSLSISGLFSHSISGVTALASRFFSSIGMRADNIKKTHNAIREYPIETSIQ